MHRKKRKKKKKLTGLETQNKDPPVHGRDTPESQPKQTMELSQERQIHSGDRPKATAEGHKGKSPRKKNGDLIATRPELGPKGDPVTKEILRSERVRRLRKKQGSFKQKERKEDKGRQLRSD